MAPRENDLSERTLAEKTDGIGDKQEGLGKLSPVTPAKHPARAPSTARSPVNARDYLQSVSTDLRARDQKGNRLPTLAERVAKEGYAAQLKTRAKKIAKLKGDGKTAKANP